MQEEDKENKSIQDDTYLLYTKAISLFEMIQTQYNEGMKNSFDLAVLEILKATHNNKEVYERILEYMHENDIYYRHIKPILEMQFVKEENNQVQIQEKPKQEDNKQTTDDSNVATEVQKTKDIDPSYIQRLFKIDD